jgi:hypothetical protein
MLERKGQAVLKNVVSTPQNYTTKVFFNKFYAANSGEASITCFFFRVGYIVFVLSISISYKMETWKNTRKKITENADQKSGHPAIYKKMKRS